MTKHNSKRSTQHFCRQISKKLDRYSSKTEQYSFPKKDNGKRIADMRQISFSYMKKIEDFLSKSKFGQKYVVTKEMEPIDPETKSLIVKCGNYHKLNVCYFNINKSTKKLNQTTNHNLAANFVAVYDVNLFDEDERPIFFVFYGVNHFVNLIKDSKKGSLTSYQFRDAEDAQTTKSLTVSHLLDLNPESDWFKVENIDEVLNEYDSDATFYLVQGPTLDESDPEPPKTSKSKKRSRFLDDSDSDSDSDSSVSEYSKRSKNKKSKSKKRNRDKSPKSKRRVSRNHDYELKSKKHHKHHKKTSKTSSSQMTDKKLGRYDESERNRILLNRRSSGTTKIQPNSEYSKRILAWNGQPTSIKISDKKGNKEYQISTTTGCLKTVILKEINFSKFTSNDLISNVKHDWDQLKDQKINLAHVSFNNNKSVGFIFFPTTTPTGYLEELSKSPQEYLYFASSYQIDESQPINTKELYECKYFFSDFTFIVHQPIDLD